MDQLKFNGNGTDAVYLARANMFFSVLFESSIFRKEDWPAGKLGSQSVLQKSVDWFRQMFEGGLTGNRHHIAARKSARKDLDVQIWKILHYLTVMADESDLNLLLSSGVVTRMSRSRPRKAAKTVATT